MKDYRECLIFASSSTLGDALAAIQNSGLGVAIVVDSEGRLVGAISDGDVRRALMLGKSLEDYAALHMNTNPIYWSGGKLLSRGPRSFSDVFAAPVVDKSGVVLGIQSLGGQVATVKNKALIMAGGKGTRLMPLTKDRPKPLVEIGGQPMLGRLLTKLRTEGFMSVSISVGHLKDQIIEYVDDGSRWGLSVDYIEEASPLGTAGALCFLQERLPVLVVNADVFTTCSFKALLDFHISSSSAITIGLREVRTRLQFGVVEIERGYVKGIQEKPELRHLVSAGVYCVNPEVTHGLNPGDYLDMPILIGGVIDSGSTVSGFPIFEQWDDLGHPEDVRRISAQLLAEGDPRAEF